MVRINSKFTNQKRNDLLKENDYVYGGTVYVKDKKRYMVYSQFENKYGGVASLSLSEVTNGFYNQTNRVKPKFDPNLKKEKGDL